MLRCALASLSVLLLAISANASEVSPEQKALVIKSFSDRLEEHKRMSVGQIKNDLFSQLSAHEKWARSHPQAGQDPHVFQDLAKLLDSVNDKDVLIHFETAQLQQLISSTNYLYFLSRELDRKVNGNCYQVGPCPWQVECRGGHAILGILFLVTLPVDTVGLVLTVPATILSDLADDDEPRSRY